jgi:hypothetical protein
VTTVRDDLAERRQERAQRRSLRHELADFTTPNEVTDLLGSFADQEGAEIDQIRGILAQNLHLHSNRTRFVA